MRPGEPGKPGMKTLASWRSTIIALSRTTARGATAPRPASLFSFLVYRTMYVTFDVRDYYISINVCYTEMCANLDAHRPWLDSRVSAVLCDPGRDRKCPHYASPYQPKGRTKREQ